MCLQERYLRTFVTMVRKVAIFVKLAAKLGVLFEDVECYSTTRVAVLVTSVSVGHPLRRVTVNV